MDNKPSLRLNFLPCSLILFPRNSDLDFCWSSEIGIIHQFSLPSSVTHICHGRYLAVSNFCQPILIHWLPSSFDSYFIIIILISSPFNCNFIGRSLANCRFQLSNSSPTWCWVHSVWRWNLPTFKFIIYITYIPSTLSYENNIWTLRLICTLRMIWSCKLMPSYNWKNTVLPVSTPFALI